MDALLTLSLAQGVGLVMLQGKGRGARWAKGPELHLQAEKVRQK